ncbi:MAG: hypothetical protein IPF44_17045 [Betaproteobacteria bacterium]|nr:hypothetical protein [Betaproteobacteria bacterium]MBP6201720.1 hypothetical protein [Azonexus sp.]
MQTNREIYLCATDLLDPIRMDKSPWVAAISGASVRIGLPAKMQRA